MYCHTNWRPTTVIFSDFPLGGSFCTLLAYKRELSLTRRSPSGLESTGLSIEESLANVSPAKANRITAAPTVQPISRRVLPWIWAATAPLREQKRNRA